MESLFLYILFHRCYQHSLKILSIRKIMGDKAAVRHITVRLSGMRLEVLQYK